MCDLSGLETWAVRTIDEIERDIDDLILFYEQVSGDEGFGKRFESAALGILNSLKIWPYINRKYSDEFDDNIRRIEIPGYNAALIYKTYDQTLEVIAVMAFHTLRDPEAYERIISERVKIADTKLRKSEDK